MVTNPAICEDNSAFGRTFSVKGNVFFTERIGNWTGDFELLSVTLNAA